MKSKTSQVTRKHRQGKAEQAIAMLNDTTVVRIAPSKVHGVGLIAIRDIRKGERIYIDAMPQMHDLPYKEFKNRRPYVSEMILERFPAVVVGSHFLSPDTLLQVYLNHSDKPNYDNRTGKMLKKVKEGEEIFEDYKKVDGYKKWKGKIYKWLK